MELPRQDPDQLLRAIRNDASTKKSGKLKIFFGYAAGVGKTYAMLQAAHQAKERGIDVVAGYIEPHARPQTMALLDGLEQLPVKQVAYEGMTLREFDIDAALKRNPQLILVDEFAHTNAESSRHTKRYQDVQELLNAGIDVYTTVNVQHIESLNDTVASITGILVRERIPDSTFDQADQVELVDIEPAELLERLASGNVYREDQAQRATVNFFTLENLKKIKADYAEKLKSMSGNEAEKLEQFQHDLDSVNEKLKNLMQLVEKGLLNEVLYQQIESLNTEKTRLEACIHEVPKKVSDAIEWTPEEVMEEYNNAVYGSEEYRLLLQRFISEIRVSKFDVKLILKAGENYDSGLSLEMEVDFTRKMIYEHYGSHVRGA